MITLTIIIGLIALTLIGTVIAIIVGGLGGLIVAADIAAGIAILWLIIRWARGY